MNSSVLRGRDLLVTEALNRQTESWNNHRPIPLQNVLEDLKDLPDQEQVRREVVWNEVYLRSWYGRPLDVDQLLRYFPEEERDEMRQEFQICIRCNRWSGRR